MISGAANQKNTTFAPDFRINIIILIVLLKV
jgi:hypothetical protein